MKLTLVLSALLLLTPPQAVLKWKTRGDSKVYGYVVYRSEARQGPFLRVSREIVHAKGAEGETIAEYSFTDTDVEANKTYYYYLDTIGLDGRKRRFSGVVSKTVQSR